MSDFRAIAAVSTTLRTLLRDRMEEPVAVTIAPPDVSVDGVGSTKRINLYLYQLGENAHLKNYDRSGSSSEPFGSPPLALELSYLLTAYGSSDAAADADLEAQVILGDAMRVLNDFAIITDDLEQLLVAGEPVLAPELRHEPERVKITLRNTSLDELSKIWTALPQANFRRSVAYQISVVQIESSKRRTMAAPVQQRRVQLSVARRPEVTLVYRTPAVGEPIGDTRVRVLQELTIEGSGFDAVRTWVSIGTLDPIGVEPQSDTQIRITVPDDTYPIDFDHAATRPIPPEQRLLAGAQSVQVLTQHNTDRVTGGLDHGVADVVARRVPSNRALFMLVPSVTGVAPASGVAGTDAAPTLLTVTGNRLFAAGHQSFVFVGDAGIEVREPGAGDTFAAPTATSVQVPISRLATDLPRPPAGGTLHRIRVIVDGAQSTETGVSFRLMP